MEYMHARLEALKRHIKAFPPDAQSPAALRFIFERRFAVVGGFDCWFFDAWTPVPVRNGDLKHSLMVMICPEDEERPPLPEGPARDTGLIDRGKKARCFSVHPTLGAEHQVLLQWFIVNHLRTIKPRLSRQVFDSPPRSTVRLGQRTSHRELLAQLLLVATRQGEADNDAMDWLVKYAEEASLAYAQPNARAVVNHALENFVASVGTLGHYLSEVSTGMSRNEQPSPGALAQASILDVSTRSIQHWTASEADVEERANALHAKRNRAELPRLLAGQNGMRPDAARRRIQREMKKGEIFDEIVAESFRKKSSNMPDNADDESDI